MARDWQNENLVWETGAGRSYLLPAGEILLYEFLLNLFDRNFVEPPFARLSCSQLHGLKGGKKGSERNDAEVNY